MCFIKWTQQHEISKTENCTELERVCVSHYWLGNAGNVQCSVSMESFLFICFHVSFLHIFWPVFKCTLVRYVNTVAICSFYSQSTQVKRRLRVESRGKPVGTCQMQFFHLSFRSLSSVKLPGLFLVFLVSCFLPQLGARAALADSQSQRSPS